MADYNHASSQWPCSGFKVTIPEVTPWLRAYYSTPAGSLGGVLHIVLEDDNTENHWEADLIESARERGDEFGEQLIHVLFSHMSRSQRHRLHRDVYLYPDVWPDVPPPRPVAVTPAVPWEHVSYDGS